VEHVLLLNPNDLSVLVTISCPRRPLIQAVENICVRFGFRLC